MSSALVRKALEFVDQEENGDKRRRRRAARRPAGQDLNPHPYKKKTKQAQDKPAAEPTVEDNIRKLIALSAPAADKTIAEKIVKRAVKGKPLLEKIEVKKDEPKSILFADEEEPYSKFEREHFCN